MNTLRLICSDGRKLDLVATISDSFLRAEMVPLEEDTSVTWVVAIRENSGLPPVRFCLGEGGLFLTATEAGVWTVFLHDDMWSLEYFTTSQYGRSTPNSSMTWNHTTEELEF